MYQNMTFFLRRLFVVLILIGLTSFACSSGMSGKYVSEKNPKNYVELKSDGTYFLQEGSMGVTGKYEVEGGQITLKTDMGFASRGNIEGKTIIDKDGDRWTKQ